MPRIGGIDIPENKKLEFSLPYIYGIGRTNVKDILVKTGLDGNKRVKDMTAEELSKLQKAVDNVKTEGDLRKDIGQNIKRLKEIGSWRGLRHSRKLPIHGRSKTNSRTLRGNVRKTMGSGRKSSSDKT